MMQRRRWYWVAGNAMLVIFLLASYAFINFTLTNVRIFSTDVLWWTSLVALFLIPFLPWFGVVVYLIVQRFGRTIATQVAVLIPLALICTNFSVISQGMSGRILWVYGNLCAMPANGCFEATPSAGFPVPFMFNNPIVSVTDAFAIPLFLFDALAYAAVFWGGYRLVIWLNQRRTRAAPARSEPVL